MSASYTWERFKNIFFLILLSSLIWTLLSGHPLWIPLTVIPVFLGIQVALTDLVEYYLVKYANSRTRWFDLLVAPGTILHELSHLFAALITGCTVTKVSLFKPDPKTGTLGFVRYSQPVDKWTVFRDLVVGFAPFFGCGILLVSINYFYGGGLIRLAQETMLAGIDEIPYFIIQVLEELWVNFSFFDPQTFTGLIILYLQATFAFGAASSTVDFKGFLKSLITHPLSSLFLLFLAFIFLKLSSNMGGEGVFASLSRILQANVILALIILVISEITVLFSIPALIVGVEFARLSMLERIPALALTLITTYTGDSIIIPFTVFAVATLFTANRDRFLK